MITDYGVAMPNQALAIPAMLLTVVGVVFEIPALLPWAALLEAGVYFYAATGLISYMLHDHRVTADELFAAGATFTLLAWAFAFSFSVCQQWYPGSFIAADASMPRIRACGWGLRSTLPTSCPGSDRSAPKRARPVTLSTPSGRAGRVPMML